MLGWSIHAARAWLTCASTRTCTSNRNSARPRGGVLVLDPPPAWACPRGTGGVAPGAFPHPPGGAELKKNLVPAEPGLYRLRGDIEQAIAQTLPPACRASVRFM